MRLHLAVRGGAAAAAVLIPLALLLPHQGRVEPDRAPIAVYTSAATPGLTSLPPVFGNATASTVRDGSERGRPELVGVAGQFPGEAVALVRLRDGPTRTIKLGDTVGDWRLSALEPDRATFARGGEHYDSVLDPVD